MRSSSLITFQDSRTLLLHMASLRMRQAWQGGPWGSSFGMESGISASMAPVRMKWEVPAFGDFNFPYDGPNYWSDHDVNSTPNSGTSKYLSEDTTLAYVPFSIGLEKTSNTFGRFSIDMRLSAGINLFFVSLKQRHIVGGLANYLEINRHSLFHLARTVGIDIATRRDIDDKSFTYATFGVNGVADVSNFEEDYTGFVSGYRFDGLRYNAKIGVAWKI